jgi:2-isopropylmalate synthase
MVSLSEAVVVVKIDGEKKLSVSESMDETGSDRGPVNALAKALAKDLGPIRTISTTCGWWTSRCASPRAAPRP